MAPITRLSSARRVVTIRPNQRASPRPGVRSRQTVRAPPPPHATTPHTTPTAGMPAPATPAHRRGSTSPHRVQRLPAPLPRQADVDAVRPSGASDRNTPDVAARGHAHRRRPPGCRASARPTDSGGVSRTAARHADADGAQRSRQERPNTTDAQIARRVFVFRVPAIQDLRFEKHLD